ncbi:arylsulfatase [Enterococcus alcedinis]|uniref:Arylsulfatase n=1 Tax=Enterococcus alcedinis TaxID=1274384 RepID=A0A917N647_9ENTE|nr:arylsulfatase [Enterococcus alcedinis]MBP2101859.1 arylsulfatase A-like enzyme [Enterococcus alcedinis]GGI65422.1 arylsulfatase [Enterococcus alcedinis]
MTKQPNIILMVVDQMRFDAMGANGNPIISTPNLDMMAENGHNFQNAYAAVPSCIPARAALMTGLSQENHGRVGYEDGVYWDYEQTLGSTFKEAGYQTQVIGKMHVYPERNRIGFDHVELHDGYLHANRNQNKKHLTQYTGSDDYLRWLKEKKGVAADIIDDGLDCNSWVARPFMEEEALHPTNWVVTKGIEFLERRDPTAPFFLNLSFVRPHSPLNPPPFYYDMYKDLLAEFPEITIGEWASEIGTNERASVMAFKGQLKKHELDRMRAAYYGLVTHIDHQIGRFLMALGEHELANNTVIVFLSDHGDQLGDHHYFRKALPYQSSIHVPFLIYDPGNCLNGSIRQIEEIVELRDVLPTLVDVATGQTLENVDGVSLRETLTNPDFCTREFLHGEHSFGWESNQYILTKEWKYIWFPIQGKEQLFDLKNDPDERHDCLTEVPERAQQLRQILIGKLIHREEGFVKDGQLVKLNHTKVSLDFLKARIQGGNNA